MIGLTTHPADLYANYISESLTNSLVGGRVINMICIKAGIPNELSLINDELKAIYHSTDTICFFIFKTRELRNEFIERTKGMNKLEREKIYEEYN